MGSSPLRAPLGHGTAAAAESFVSATDWITRKMKSAIEMDRGHSQAVYGCVCVDHLHRCKTSLCLLCAFVVVPTWFSFHICRGMECASDVSIQRRRICCTVIWIGDAQSTYLLNRFHFCPWQPAKPRTGKSIFIFISGKVVTFCLFYDFDDWPCCIRTFLSKDVESILRTEVSRWVN